MESEGVLIAQRILIIALAVFVIAWIGLMLSTGGRR